MQHDERHERDQQNGTGQQSGGKQQPGGEQQPGAAQQSGGEQQPGSAEKHRSTEQLGGEEQAAAGATAEAVAAETEPVTKAGAAETDTADADATTDAADGADGADAAALAAQAAEYYDRLLRLQAEFDNYRKRMQRERESDVKYAGERFVLALLPVLDNFERALAAIPAGDETQAWRQGIEMIQRQLFEVLEKEGVTVVNAEPGTLFDPHQHEAVLYEDSETYGEGQIIGELQRGYRLHDRLLRPSLVRVARQG